MTRPADAPAAIPPSAGRARLRPGRRELCGVPSPLSLPPESRPSFKSCKSTAVFTPHP